MSNTFTPYNSSNPTGYIPGLESLSIKTPEPDNSNVLKPLPSVTSVIRTPIKDIGFIAKEYQTLLVSDENIKTIGGISLLGSGDISLSNPLIPLYIFGGGNALWSPTDSGAINCGNA